MFNLGGAEGGEGLVFDTSGAEKKHFSSLGIVVPHTEYSVQHPQH